MGCTWETEMGVEKVTTLGPAFTTITGTIQYGGEPEQNRNAPPLRQTHTWQNVRREEGGDHQNSVDVSINLISGTYLEQTCSFEVNNAAAGAFAFPVIIYLGDFTIENGIDYAPVIGDAGATAIAIAAAIDALPGFNAVAAGVVVNVTYEQPMGRVLFEIEHQTILGMVNNELDTLIPADGFMAQNSPVIGPPVVT